MKPASGYRLVDGVWVHEEARVADDVEVEPGVVIGSGVDIDSGTWIGAGAVIHGPTRIGKNNRIFPTAVIGGPPQDVGYGGEPTRLEIGDGNVFREGVTVHRASQKGDGVTRVGNHNFFMANTHVGHDCVIEDHVITANDVLFAGHCHVQSHANFAGGAALSQFVTVGRHAFMIGLLGARRDLEPFVIHGVEFGTGPESSPQCINDVGLKRAGFSVDAIRKLRGAYKALFPKEGKRDPAEVRAELAERDTLSSEVEEFLQFVERKLASRYGRQLQ